jgi:hypothetical protein
MVRSVGADQWRLYLEFAAEAPVLIFPEKLEGPTSLRARRWDDQCVGSGSFVFRKFCRDSRQAR